MSINKIWYPACYRKKDKKAIISLFKKHYSKTELSNPAFYKWQLEKNPAGKAIIRLAKNKKGRIIGFYCLIPQKFKIGDKELLGSVSINTLIDKNYRRLGIFTTLAKQCYQNCQKKGIYFTIAFPNPNSYPGFVKKLKFFTLTEVPLLLKPINWKALLTKKLKNNFLNKSLCPLRLFLNLVSIRRNKEDLSEITEVKKIDIEFDKLWLVLKDKYQIISSRHSRFLNWRFNWPSRKYKIFTYKKAYQILGFIALRKKTFKKINNGLIVDFLLKPKVSPVIGEKLIEKAINYFLKNKVDQIGCLIMKNSQEYQLLRRKGFFPCPRFLKPQPLSAILKWHRGKMPSLLKNPNNWFLTMADYDIG